MTAYRFMDADDLRLAIYAAEMNQAWQEEAYRGLQTAFEEDDEPDETHQFELNTARGDLDDARHELQTLRAELAYREHEDAAKLASWNAMNGVTR